MEEKDYQAAMRKIEAEEAAQKALREKKYGEGNVFTTDEATAAFEFESFLAPCAFVTRRSDGVRGTLLFDHRPRVYYGFEPR